MMPYTLRHPNHRDAGDHDPACCAAARDAADRAYTRIARVPYATMERSGGYRGMIRRHDRLVQLGYHAGWGQCRNGGAQ